jgi:hypothetical protein
VKTRSATPVRYSVTDDVPPFSKAALWLAKTSFFS